MNKGANCVDRIERHDLINAVGLAAVLVVLAFGFLWAAQSLYDTVRNDAVSTETTLPVVNASTTTTTTTSVDDTTTTSAVELRPVGEITVKVANGAGISGIAGHQTEVLAQAGYQTESPGNVDNITGAGQVYYIEGYEAEAKQVARLFGLTDEQVAAMPDPPPVELGTAQILVIAGPDTTVRP